jgi:putative membrane protein
MNNSFNFSEFSKQSPKGIVVIYLNLIYKSIKLTWILLFFVVRDFYKIVNYTGGYIYLIFFLLMLVLLIRAILLYNNFQFKIDKEHFVLNQGILSKTNTSIPFHRIQNINFKQNIVQQIINVFEVSIETAGSKDTEIAIKALSFKKGKALKEEILNSSSIDKEVIENLDKPLVKINIKELFKVSLTENHLQSLLLFLAVLIGFFQQIQQVLDGLGETEALDGFIQ